MIFALDMILDIVHIYGMTLGDVLVFVVKEKTRRQEMDASYRGGCVAEDSTRLLIVFS